MRQKGDTLGFSIGEVAFVLLFSFVIITIAVSADSEKERSENRDNVNHNKELSRRNNELTRNNYRLNTENQRQKRRIEELEHEVVQYEKTIQQSRGRSDIPQRCTTPSLFSVEILPNKQYRLDGKVVTLAQLRSLYKPVISKMLEEQGCMPVITTRVSSSLSVSDYREGLMGLEELSYYVRR